MPSTFKKRIFTLFFFLLPTMFIFGVSLWATLLFWYPEGISHEQLALHVNLFSLIGICWLALYYGFGLFDLETHRSANKWIPALIGANCIGLIVAAIIFYVQPNFLITPRRFLFVDVVCVFLLSMLWQLIVRTVSNRFIHRTIYFLDLEPEYSTLKSELDHHAIGTTTRAIVEEQLSSLKKSQTESCLFVLPNDPAFSDATTKLLTTFHTQGVSFIRFDQFYEEAFRRVYTTHLNDWWLLEHTHHDQMGIYPIVKRLFDLFCAIVIGIIFLLTFPFMALLLKCSDGGKIFFTQIRLSVNGTPFTIYKYRTMRAGTPNNTWTEDQDPRVTPVGRFLRKTRLDELPQWINMLRGDMSLIGPRPEQAGIVEQLKTEIPYFESRHTIRPGLIGWAQLHVYANNVTESKQKLQYDLYYLKHRSFLFDSEIFLKTIAHVFFLNGK